jgi:O-antigen/teichoic acid export membrane protein
MIKKLASRLLGESVVSSAPIVRGVALSYADLFVSIAVSIALTPVILHHLGQSAYGLWAVFGSVVGYFGLFGFGMNSATVKYTAEYHAKSDLQALSRLVSTMVLGIAGIGLAIIVISFGLLPWIPRIFHLPASLVATGQIAFVLMASNVALGLVAGTFNNVIYGFQRVDVIRTFGIVQSVVNLCLTLLFLRWGFGLVGVVLASSAALFMLLFLSLVFLYKSKYRIAIRPSCANLQTLKEIAPYSFRSFILGLTATVLYRTDNIVIGIFLTVAAVAPYSIAYKLSYLGAMVMFRISTTLFPTFTRLYTLGSMDGLRSLYLKTARLSMTIVVPFALILVLAGRGIIDLWVGDTNFVGQSVLVVLVLMNFIHASSGPAAQLLQAVGKNKEFTYSATVNAVLNLGLSIFLCLRMGVIGVALGTLIAHLLTDTWVVTWLACRYISLPLKTYFFKSILPPLLAGVPAVLITSFLFARFLGRGLASVSLETLSIVGIYLVTALIFERVPLWRIEAVPAGMSVLAGDEPAGRRMATGESDVSSRP